MKLENALRRKAIAFDVRYTRNGARFIFTDKRGKQWMIDVDENGKPVAAYSIRIRSHNWMYRPRTPHRLQEPTPAMIVIERVLKLEG